MADEVLLNAPAPETTYGKDVGITDGTFYTSDESGLVEVWPRHVAHLLTQGFTPVAPVAPVESDDPLLEDIEPDEHSITDPDSREATPPFAPGTGGPLAESADTTGGSTTEA